MATQPRAGDGAAAAAAAKEAPAVSYLQACVELDDWWLERVEGEEGKVRVVGSNTTTSRAGRRFTSASIKTRHASGDLETEDGIIIMIARPPNISKMHLNGFPDEVGSVAVTAAAKLQIHDTPRKGRRGRLRKSEKRKRS
nr:uncharacterized protein LOC4327793 isoform X3 [Oryza sativa Japonica Group]